MRGAPRSWLAARRVSGAWDEVSERGLSVVEGDTPGGDVSARVDGRDARGRSRGIEETLMPAVPRPAKGSGRLDRHARRAEEEKALAEAYEVANLRDGNQCRVTGRFLQPSAVDSRVRREHHHLTPRSLAPDRVDDPSNIILVCREAHDLITGKFLHVEGTDASKPVFFFWDEEAMRGKVKPFRIIGKRTSVA